MGRYFIAIAPSGLSDNAELKQLVGKMKRTLSERERQARWVHPDLWHVTLEFLGEIDDEGFVKLSEVFNSWSPKGGGMTIRLQGVGAFPNPDQARSLWVGVHENQKFLDLQADLRGVLAAAGFSVGEHEFRPHLTLARLRNLQSLSDLVSLGGRKSFGEYPVDEAILFQSVLQGAMPKYIPKLRRALQ